MNIRTEFAKNLKPKPTDEAALPFGKIFTDHMFAMNYNGEKGWHDARIVPYAPFEISPAATCLHYGQLVFEGMKAYRNVKNEIVLFRPEMNMLRLNSSSERLCIPAIDVDFMVSAISTLVETEKDWVPSAPATSLYIRPFILSTDSFLGVSPSDSYLLLVILCPVGPYYPQGLAPVSIFVENDYVRAVRGGTGYTKCAGNYAASLRSQVNAKKQGYSQVLWLDGVEKKYIEEVGAMNVFFVLENEIVTPELNGSILGGITRDSIITLLKDWGMPVIERKVSMEELATAHKLGKLKEAFGTGTAAVISPMGELAWGENIMQINGGEIGQLSKHLYDHITGVQTGKVEDKFGWVKAIVNS